jgi:hypothetical protein
MSTCPCSNVCISAHARVFMYPCVLMPVYLCAHMPTSHSICMSTCPTMHQCTCQGIYVFTCPHASIYTVCAHMPTYQSIYISACPHFQLCISAHARVFMYSRILMLVFLRAHMPTGQSIYISACSHVQLCILCISAHARVFTYSSVLILVQYIYVPTCQSIYVSACPHVQVCIGEHARVSMCPRDHMPLCPWILSGQVTQLTHSLTLPQSRNHTCKKNSCGKDHPKTAGRKRKKYLELIKIGLSVFYALIPECYV